MYLDYSLIFVLLHPITMSVGVCKEHLVDIHETGSAYRKEKHKQVQSWGYSNNHNTSDTGDLTDSTENEHTAPEDITNESKPREKYTYIPEKPLKAATHKSRLDYVNDARNDVRSTSYSRTNSSASGTSYSRTNSSASGTSYSRANSSGLTYGHNHNYNTHHKPNYLKGNCSSDSRAEGRPAPSAAGGWKHSSGRSGDSSSDIQFNFQQKSVFKADESSLKPASTVSTASDDNVSSISSSSLVTAAHSVGKYIPPHLRKKT